MAKCYIIKRFKHRSVDVIQTTNRYGLRIRSFGLLVATRNKLVRNKDVSLPFVNVGSINYHVNCLFIGLNVLIWIILIDHSWFNKGQKKNIYWTKLIFKHNMLERTVEGPCYMYPILLHNTTTKIYALS